MLTVRIMCETEEVASKVLCDFQQSPDILFVTAPAGTSGTSSPGCSISLLQAQAAIASAISANNSNFFIIVAVVSQTDQRIHTLRGWHLPERRPQTLSRPKSAECSHSAKDTQGVRVIFSFLTLLINNNNAKITLFSLDYCKDSSYVYTDSAFTVFSSAKASTRDPR